MAQKDDFNYDLQPADDIGSGELDIVFRSLNFAASSGGQSPYLIIILAEENVSFRVLYGWDHDDLDGAFSTDLVGRRCRVSGVRPRYLTNFSAWLRDVSGATDDSSVSCLPRPICQSAREMWESLCELKKKFAADAFCLGKEIRRRVEAWEVVNADLNNFFMDTNEEPSEEDRVSVFGSASPATVGSTDVSVGALSSSPSLSPPAPPPTPSPAALVSTSSSSLNAEAAEFEPARSPAATTTTTASVPAQQHLSCRQRKWAREVAFRQKIADKIQKRIAKREALAAASSASSTSTSTSPSFLKPLPPVRKSVVVVPGPSKHSPASSTVTSVPSAKKRERSEGLPVLQRPSFPSSAPSASLEDTWCATIDSTLIVRKVIILVDSNGRKATSNSIMCFVPKEEKADLRIEVVVVYTLEEAREKVERGEIKVGEKVVMVDCLTNNVRKRKGRPQATPEEVVNKMNNLIDLLVSRRAAAVVACEVKPLRDSNVRPFNEALHRLYLAKKVRGCYTRVGIQHLGSDGFHVKPEFSEVINKTYAYGICGMKTVSAAVPRARKRSADRARESEEAVKSGVITSFFANKPSSSSSSRIDSSPSTSSSLSAPPSKRSKVEYESRRALRRQHEEMGSILNLLNLPKSVISTKEVEDLVDRAMRAHAESRDRSRSPLPSSSTSSSSRTSRSPSRSSSSQRRSPSSSTSRSSSFKDRLGVRTPLAGGAAAGTSSSYSPIYSVDNPPPQSVFRCSDVRVTSGEVSGFTERADEPMESSETSSERRGDSRKDWKGKGRGKKSGGGKK